MDKILPCIAAVLIALAPTAALAEPEGLDQLEPGAGEWQGEWVGNFRGGGEQGLEVLAGLDDRLVVGGELEFEGPRNGLVFEEASAILMYRFADPEEAPVGFGLMGEVSVGRDGHVSGLETRAIVELQRPRWWLQGNAILRHAREDGANGTGLAYSTSVQRKVAGLWFGVEASGQAAHLGGDAGLAPAGQHYAGPSLTIEQDLERAEVEVGLSSLFRIAGGEGPKSHPRIFIQLTF